MGSSSKKPFIRFNGATDLHRWKLITLVIICTSYLSFNGATDLHRWKPEKSLENNFKGMFASMGPPIYIGGNLPPFWVWAGDFLSFNGATDLHRWKLSISFHPVVFKLRLQWGHRFTSVETSFLSYYKMADSKLQWGHRFTSVETRPTYKITLERVAGFNGATDLHRWKRRISLNRPSLER